MPLALEAPDLYIFAGNRRYTFNEIVKLWSGAKKTPFVDGSGLKHTLERETVAYLQDKSIVDFSSKKVLLVCAVDRFGMAEALALRAKSIVFGDLFFNLGIPIPVRSMKALNTIARWSLPVIIHLPFKWLYPTGEKQEKITPKWGNYYAEADVIAGDFHLIRRFMPDNLAGKIVLTNTTTETDSEALKQRGVTQLITTTPVFDGRSFGTNVMEAVLNNVNEQTASRTKYQAEEYLGKLARVGVAASDLSS